MPLEISEPYRLMSSLLAWHAVPAEDRMYAPDHLVSSPRSSATWIQKPLSMSPITPMNPCGDASGATAALMGYWFWLDVLHLRFHGLLRLHRTYAARGPRRYLGLCPEGTSESLTFVFFLLPRLHLRHSRLSATGLQQLGLQCRPRQ